MSITESRPGGACSDGEKWSETLTGSSLRKLDSKNIYISSRAYLPKITWESKGSDPDSMWIYLGLKDEFNEAILKSAIDMLFSEATVYFVDGKKNSTWYPTAELTSKIRDRLADAHSILLVWDHDFRIVMELNKIGIFRYGRRLNTNV